MNHPLQTAFDAAINQATSGKGTRHGGDKTPFLEQDWRRIAHHHGIGFLTGQAEKKLSELSTKATDEEWRQELLGAIVYLGMAYLFNSELRGDCDGE